MDTYWITKEIDSDQRDYKLWFELIEKCSECPILYNDEGLKYQVLVEELKRHGYVPEDWYKQYVIFGEKFQ